MCFKKYIFDKRFKFKKYPNLLKSHEEYHKLLDDVYIADGDFDAGKITQSEYDEIDQKWKDYKTVYAKEIYKTFYGKDLVLIIRSTKELVLFDDIFGDSFDALSYEMKGRLVGIVESKYGYKLPAKYYGK